MFNNGFTYDAFVKYNRIFRERMDSMKSFIIASNITELGYPIFDPSIPTASVGISDHSSRVEYRFNPEFFFKLCDQDLAFVMVHEILHVTFNHMSRFMKLLGKTKGSEFTQEDVQKIKTFNIAADCIVNTWAKLLGFQPTDYLVNPKTFGLHFPDTIGYPNFNSGTTCEDIYVWLMNQPKDILEVTLQQDTLDSHDNWDKFTGPSADNFKEGVAGSIKEEFFKKVEKGIDSDNLKKLKDQYKDKQAEKGKFDYNPSKNTTYGNEKRGEICHYKLLKDRVQTDVLRTVWQKIKSIYDLTPKETWTRLNKKLSSMWHLFRLPAISEMDDPSKYDVLLFIDSSGSITPDMKSQFVRMIRSFPMDKIDYTPMSFDTKPYELNKAQFYNLNAYPEILGGGGTNIDVCEEYIQKVYMKKKKRRPNLVFILTDADGRCSFPIPPEVQDTYVWILVKNARAEIAKAYCPRGHFIQTNIQ